MDDRWPVEEFTTSRGDYIAIDMRQVATAEDLGRKGTRIFLAGNASGFDLTATYTEFRDLWRASLE